MMNCRAQRSCFRLFLMLCFGMCLSASPTVVQAGGTDEKEKQGAHDDPHKDHHFSMFVGASHAGLTEFALGGDYAYRLPFWNRTLSVAALVDATVFADHVHTLIGGGVTVHPFAGLKVLAAPAVGLSEGHSTFTMRVGAGYDVHVGSFSVTPTFNLDFSDGHTTKVFGLGFGMGF